MSSMTDRDHGREWWRPALAVGSQGRSAARPSLQRGGYRVGNVAEDVALKEGRSAGAFWGLIGYTFILLIAPHRIFPVLGPLHIGAIVSGLAIIAYLFDWFVRGQPLTVRTREIWLAAGLAGWTILTTPLAYRSPASYSQGGSVSLVLEYFKTLVIFWLLCNTVSTLTRLRQVTWALSLMAIPMAATAVRDFLSGSFLPNRNPEAPARIFGYDASMTANPNDLALMLNLIIPLSVALLVTAQRRAVRVLLVVAISLEVVAVIATFSRGGFLTLATVVGIYLWRLSGRPARACVWALVVALVCLPLLPSGYLKHMATITDVESDITHSAQVRRDGMTAAVRFVLLNPIVGAGMGMGPLAMSYDSDQKVSGWTAIHNVYLQHATDLGLPGLILFLCLLVACVKSVVAVQRRSAPEPGRREVFYLAEGIQISLLAFSVAALFHPVAYSPYFYYIGGLAVAIKLIDAARDRDLALRTAQA